MNFLQEDWLSKEGYRIVRKIASDGKFSLNDREKLFYEMWLFDTEQRNGGTSQYFCNRSLEQWNLLLRLASPVLTSFPPFAEIVNQVVGHASDPYQAIVDSNVDLDAQYEKHRSMLIEETKAFCQ